MLVLSFKSAYAIFLPSTQADPATLRFPVEIDSSNDLTALLPIFQTNPTITPNISNEPTTRLALDTGSDVSWVVSDSCLDQVCQEKQRFQTSSTPHKEAHVHYGGGGDVWMRMMDIDVESVFASKNKQKSAVPFGFATRVSSTPFDTMRASGLLALGRKSAVLKYFGQVGIKIDAEGDKGEVVLGKEDKTVSYFQSIPLPQFPGAWALPIISLRVGHNTIPHIRKAVIDTGAACNFGSKEVFMNLLESIQEGGGEMALELKDESSHASSFLKLKFDQWTIKSPSNPQRVYPGFAVQEDLPADTIVLGVAFLKAVGGVVLREGDFGIGFYNPVH